MKTTTKLVLALLALTSVSVFAATQTGVGAKIGREDASKVSYAVLVGGNDGDPIYTGKSVRSVQVSAVSGSAVIIVEGSNNGVTYTTLTDTTSAGASLSFSAAGIKNVREMTAYIRARSTGPVSTAATVDFLISK